MTFFLLSFNPEIGVQITWDPSTEWFQQVRLVFPKTLIWEEAGIQGTGNTDLRCDLTAYPPFAFPTHDPFAQEIQNMFSLSFTLSLSPSSSLQVIIHYLWQCQTFTPNSILSDFTSQWWKEQRQTESFIMAGRLSLLTQTPWAGRSNHHQWLRGNFPWGAGLRTLDFLTQMSGIWYPKPIWRSSHVG